MNGMSTRFVYTFIHLIQPLCIELSTHSLCQICTFVCDAGAQHLIRSDECQFAHPIRCEEFSVLPDFFLSQKQLNTNTFGIVVFICVRFIFKQTSFESEMLTTYFNQQYS